MFYYEIAPNRIIRAGSDSFTFSSDKDLPLGLIVEVEIGSRNYVGVIIEKNTPRPNYATKPILRIVEETPLPQAIVSLSQWMSTHYATPLPVVLQTILPSGLNKKRRDSAAANTPVDIRERTQIVFTEEQSKTLQEIDTMNPGAALLHGVTGSGKTAIYIEAARKILASGKSAIVLVPEIALTSQLVAEFSHHFKDVILTHSKQTEAERHKQWSDALKSDKPRLVIGPRSALFMPVPHLGLIVIDECHEPSYKQEQSPRYSALEVAKHLCRLLDGKAIFGSATPTISDYYDFESTGRPILTMSQTAKQSTPPEITLIDMTKKDNFSSHRFLSKKLLSSIDETLAANKQVLIFHNRRGSATVTRCDACGWQAGCPRCFIPLTLHADHHSLSCHLCGFSTKVPTSCPECASTDILHKGIGTKLIETELARLYPNNKIVRFDGDGDKHSTVNARYQDIYSGDIDIVIGTQVVAKGLDLPHLRTVGIIQADAGLSMPDYSSPERTFQLLAQVIGRVGRSHHKTNVVIQSYQPTHPAVQDGINRDYKDFYSRSLKLRKHTNFPPYTHLLKLTCIYKTEKAAVSNAKKLSAELSKESDIELLGPTPAFYERIRDTYRWQIIVKSSHREKLLHIANQIPKTHWQTEIDPTSLL